MLSESLNKIFPSFLPYSVMGCEIHSHGQVRSECLSPVPLTGTGGKKKGGGSKEGGGRPPALVGTREYEQSDRNR